MTTINLVKEIAKRIESDVSRYNFQESDGVHVLRTPCVWEQHLPEKLFDQKVDPSDYPFVQVFCSGSRIVRDNDRVVRYGDVVILVAGYDDGIEIGDTGVRDQQGWLIPSEIIDMIVSSLLTKPVVGGKHEVQVETITTELPEDQPIPLWYGTMSASFTIPVPPQGFGMEDWVMNQTIPPNVRNVEEIYT